MKPTYVTFYIEGREDRLLRHDIDVEQIASQVMAGKGTIHEILTKAARAAAEPLLVARKKRDWLDDFAEDIKTAGGDGEEAYRHYIDGRIDELAFSLERDVVEALADACGVETDGDQSEGDDGDDEDEGEDDE